MGRIADDDPGLAAYLDRVERYPLLDREAELHLARRWREAGDRRAGDELITANLRFVVRIALRYRGYGLRVADLVEEGNLGLLEALRRFEPERHLRFMTYAGYWARAYILAHVLKQRSLVGVGTGPLQSRLFFGLARERARLVAALGPAASGDEIEARLATRFRTTPERIREIGARLDAKDASVDAPAYRDGDRRGTLVGDLLTSGTPPLLEALAVHERDQAIRRCVDAVRRTLPERERYIVDRRLYAEEEETLAQVGRALKLSRERVRQLEARIKAKLRRALEQTPAARA